MDKKTEETIEDLNAQLDEVNRRIAKVKKDMADDLEKLNAAPRPKLMELAKTTPPTFGWVIHCVGAGLAAGLIIAIINKAFFSDDPSTPHSSYTQQEDVK